MTSYHCLLRAKERLGFNGRYASRVIEKGIERGQSADNFKSKPEREWLKSRSQYGYQALAYNGICLIVSPCGNCVTVYELPLWFGKKIQFDQHKRRIRNYLKYSKLNLSV